MHWITRTISLFLGAVLAECFVIWLASSIGHFDFPFLKGAEIFPIFKVAFLSTVYSLMLPPANWTVNNGSWGNHGELEIFFITSLFIIPLVLVFPVPEQKIQAIFMSRSEYLWPFLAVWIVQGLINVIHVHLSKKSTNL